MVRLGVEARREGWLRVIALVIAAVIGLDGVGRMAVAAPQRFTFEVAGRADVLYAPVRASLAPGDRIGLVIPGRSEADDQVRWFTAQYALAPAIVLPVRLAACQRALSDPACGVAPLDRVLATVQPAVIGALGDALGLVPERTAGQVVVYRRRTP